MRLRVLQLVLAIAFLAYAVFGFHALTECTRYEGLFTCLLVKA
jgi:hypothetical protein